jgi:S1-C subfamily serine protease
MFLVPVIAVVVAACGGNDSTSAETSTPTVVATTTATVVPPTPSPAPPAATATPEADPVLTTVEVVRALTPSVVQIVTSQFTMGMENELVPTGLGTGIILDREGHILTNNHVVQGAHGINVILDTGETFTATLIGGDLNTDTAVVRIDADGLKPARLGDSTMVEIGEDVIAIGHALGLAGGPTVSKGVVSALGRSLETDARTQTTIVDLIQTDASINPGNSGGPLVNDRGEVIGINTAIIQQSQGQGTVTHGIGFAIGINNAMEVALQLIAKGFVTRGYLGVSPINVNPARASQFDLPVDRGVLLYRVGSNSAAHRAGLRNGDLLIQLDDRPISNTGDLSKFLLEHPPGDTVDATIYPAGSDKTVVRRVTLGERPE